MTDNLLLGTGKNMATLEASGVNYEKVSLGGRAQAVAANLSAVADLAQVEAMFDKIGRLVVVPSAIRDRIVKGSIRAVDIVTPFVNPGETTLITAGASGVFHDLIFLAVFNGSLANVFEVRDSTGAANLRFACRLATNGGFVLQFPAPLKQTTAAQNWTGKIRNSVNGYSMHMLAVALEWRES